MHMLWQSSHPDEPAPAVAGHAAFLLDALGAAGFELDLRSGAVCPSPRLSALFGYPAEPPLTLADYKARFHPDDRPTLQALLPSSLERADGRFQQELRLVLPDGATRWLIVYGETLRDAAGLPTHVRGAAIDISERKRHEAHGAFLDAIMAGFAPLKDADDIMRLASARTTAHFGLSRCVFVEINEAADEARVIYDHCERDLPSLVGTYRLADFHTDEERRLLGAGRQIVVGDVADETRAAAAAERFAQLQIGALVNSPYVADGRWQFVLSAMQAEPRAWHDDEVALLQELSARIWPRIARARSEAALRESEERYRTLIDSLDQGFCLVEVLYGQAGAATDYRFLKVNQTFERHTGLRDVVGRTAHELIPGLERHWVEQFARVAETGAPAHFEQGSDTLGRWFEAEAVRVGAPERRQVAVIFTDVTARRRADADARFLAEVGEQIRLRDDADQLLEAVTHLLGPQLGATRCFVVALGACGERWAARHEYCAAGAPLGDRRLPPPPQALVAALRAGQSVSCDDAAVDERTAPSYPALAPLGIRAFAAVGLRHKQGELDALAVAAHTPRGWTARELSLLELVAERTWNAVERLRLVAAQRASAARLEQLYAQEQAARAQAEEASRLKDEFLAVVSHELRTPLTAFLGYTQLLQRGKRDEAFIARTVETMLQSARAQAVLIEDLLDVSRIVTGKLRISLGPVALGDVVRAALDTVRPTVEAKGVLVRAELDPAVGVVQGDASRLEQVLWNLLSNAAKFTPPGGLITVRLTRAGESAELSVRDTGQGIREEFLPYVFDRFRQADSSSQRVHGGLGLGLAIVRHLVELHGGTVEAASAGAGCGAAFTVRLPLAEGGAIAGAGPAPAAAEGPGAAQPLGGLRVLIVDDQPASLELVGEMLTADGAETLACATAREALAQLRAWRPDVLIADIAMPHEDGYWLIRQVRGLGPAGAGATPAAALTAYVREEDQQRVMAAGFQQYLRKPVDHAELRDVVRRLATARQ